MSNGVDIMDYVKEIIKRNASAILYVLITSLACAAQILLLNKYEDYLFFENIIFTVLVVLLFYRIIFHRLHENVLLKVVCLSAIIISANRLYSYERLTKLLPWIATIKQSWLITGAAAIIILILVLFRLISYLGTQPTDMPKRKQPRNTRVPFSAKEDPKTEEKAEVSNLSTASHDRQSAAPPSAERREIPQQKGSNTVFRRVALVLIALISLVAPVGIIQLINRSGFSEFELKYEGNFKYLINDAFLYFFSVFVVLFFLLFFFSLLKSIGRSVLSNNSQAEKEKKDPPDSLFLYSTSVIISLFIIFFSWLVTGASVDSLIDKFTSSDYLVAPIAIIVTIVLFFLIVQLVHAIILTLPFATGINTEDNRFGNRIAGIIDLITEIILSSIEAILKFIQFIPNFFIAVSVMVLYEDTLCEDNVDNSGKENGPDSQSSKEKAKGGFLHEQD